ncbi:hypothetical protein EVAR_38550_1 [Eumeta japonica]|uniref:Uncharacterized protein n=1 Tax=Eumeta variegata TaxID=151549 RepID=A0A4C1WEM8_EUMVA|nr:hypothetical protein EVAR_38550_1 [Eumeta japonica]
MRLTQIIIEDAAEDALQALRGRARGQGHLEFTIGAGPLFHCDGSTVFGWCHVSGGWSLMMEGKILWPVPPLA